MLKLQLGSNMNPRDIEEGDDVYFDCEVNANPGAYKVVWKHNVSSVRVSLSRALYIPMYSSACARNSSNGLAAAAHSSATLISPARSRFLLFLLLLQAIHAFGSV